MAKTTFADQVGRDDLSVRRERALLVGVLLNAKPAADDPLVELAELARSAGAEVVDRTTQRRRSYATATCVGRGKLEEIRQRADVHEASVVIFDNDLSPSQIREIEKAVDRKVIDRSELILDIFASRARTAEARLQVELAQLEYTAPRLRGMWSHLERIAGAGGGGGVGAVGGIGTRGPGERQIEIDRRLVGKRITVLKEKLAAIDRRRKREVLARKEFFQVSLVGYTNAGKSTLMNALTGAGAKVEDRLFMTLDTLTRRWELGGGRSLLLSDTVGFVRDLPHHLVASFKATLEEALHADLLLHVADVSNPDLERQIEAVEQVLASLGAGGKPTVLVLNKVDAQSDESILAVLRDQRPDAICVSAARGDGLSALTQWVDDQLQGQQLRLTLSVPAGDGKALQFLDRFADVLTQTYQDDRVLMDVRISARSLDQLHAIARDIRHVENEV
jgi:GTP-binding protein HflX